jgi:glycerophosphoryl diester phosphodiesterase
MMQTLNIAHRGARSLAPENTIQAVRKAAQLGCDGIEVDIRLTSDLVPVLHHDATLERTTDVARKYPDRSFLPISTFSFTELQRLDAGSWFIQQDPYKQIEAGAVNPTELREIRMAMIPSLGELLGYVKDTGLLVNLELKRDGAPQDRPLYCDTVLETLSRERVDTDTIRISSFDHELLRCVQERAPKIEIQALIGYNRIKKNNWGTFEFGVYNANAAYMDEKQYLAAREHGCGVNLYTVNTPADMARFIAWGIDGIITDFPQLLSRQLQKNA